MRPGNYVKVVQRIPVKIVLRARPGSGSSAASRHVGHADHLYEQQPMTAASEQRVVNPWIVAIAVMFATFMEVLDTTVVNVSLPHIAGNLSASIDESTWVLTSYLVANAIVLPLTGWLARHFGRKRLLMTSVAGFTISSLLCGIAPNLPLLVAFRLLQGATGGAMQPLSQAVLLEAFPPHERGKAMGFWGLGIVVAPILGPGARRLAHRYVQLALGLLHQPPGRYRIARHDQAVRVRSRRTCGRRRTGLTTGASGSSHCGSARCNSRSISARNVTGSRHGSSPRWSSSQ